MKKIFIPSLLLLFITLFLSMNVYGKDRKEKQKVVGHFHKKNGHTKRVVAKKKSGKEHLGFGHLYKEKDFIGSKTIQKGYNDEIIEKLSKKPSKNSLKDVICFANDFSKKVGTKFDALVEIENVKLPDGRVLFLKAALKDGTVDSYIITISDNKNQYDLLTIKKEQTSNTVSFGKDDNVLKKDTLLNHNSSAITGVLSLMNEYGLIDDKLTKIKLQIKDAASCCDKEKKISDTTYKLYLNNNNSDINLSASIAKYLIDSNQYTIDSATKGITKIDYSINKNNLSATSFTNNITCNCGSFNKDSVKKYATESCYGCNDGTMLIYDAKCKQFWEYNRKKITKVTKISNVRLKYGQAFKIKFIRFNRYLYNINVASSDIAFSSSEPQLMQNYLFPKNGDTSASRYNSFASGASNNDGSHLFDFVPNLRSNVDKITLKVTDNVTEKYISIYNLLNKYNNRIQEINDSLYTKTIESISGFYKRISDSNGINNNHKNQIFNTHLEKITNFQQNKLKAESEKNNSIINEDDFYFKQLNLCGKYDRSLFDNNICAFVENSEKAAAMVFAINTIFEVSSAGNNISAKDKNDGKSAIIIIDTSLTKSLTTIRDSLVSLLQIDVDCFDSCDCKKSCEHITLDDLKRYTYLRKLKMEDILQGDKNDLKHTIEKCHVDYKKYKTDSAYLKKHPKGRIAKETVTQEKNIAATDLKDSVRYSYYLKSDTNSLNELDSFRTAIDALNSNEKLKKLSEAFQTSLDTFIQLYDGFLDKKINAYSICTNSFPCCKDNPELTYSVFDTRIKNITEKYMSLRAFINNTNNAASKELTTPDPIIKIQRDTLKIIYTDSLDKKGNPILTDTGSAKKMYKVKKDTLLQGKPFIPVVQKTDTISVTSADYIISNNVITGFKFRHLPDTTKAAKPKAAANKISFDEVDSLWINFEKISSADIMRFILFNNNMVSENMSYTSVPIIPYGDRMGLTLTVGPTDSVVKMGIMPTSVDNISFDFPIYRKTLFNFSTGTFIALDNVAKSPTYEYQQIHVNNTIPPGSPYRLVQNDPGALPIGFDALANTSWRLFGSFNIGISGGVGVITDPAIRLAYLAGGTISVGNYQRFHFTAGIAGIQVKRLNADTDMNLLYQSNPGSVSYITTLQHSWFLSATYTVFSVKATGNQQSSTQTKSTGN